MTKKDSFYFDNFCTCANLAGEAAKFLLDILKNFDADAIEKKLEEMHKIEHRADTVKHNLFSEIMRAFITPIERDDILKLSNSIDEVIDSIEDVLLHIYTGGVKAIRPDAVAQAEVVVTLANSLSLLLEEFRNFKKSKKLKEIIVEINRLEEDGDRAYIKSMRNLHTGNSDALEVIPWRDIFNNLEAACDACEHVADIVEGVIIENT